MLEKISLGHIAAAHHERRHLLAALMRRPADDGSVRHRRMSGQRLLDLGRINVDAAANDHVLGTSGKIEKPLRVEIAEIARGIPSGSERGRAFLGVAVEAVRDSAAAVAKAANRAAIARLA